MMENPIAAILEQQNFIVLDGALATELEARGCDLNDPLWSARVLLESPELIRAVHEDYFRAGADCATTASYQATFAGFAQRGIGQARAAELMRLSVTLALEARDAFWADSSNHVGRCKPFVAASVGPYGAFLADGSEYSGGYGLSQAQLEAFHRPRMAVLASSGADLLALETVPSLLEARALVKVLEEFSHLSAWLSFSAKNSTQICNGETLEECAATFAGHPQIAALGINCTAPEYVADLIGSARGVTDAPLLAYPNSGERYDPVDKRWSGEDSCADFVSQARLWLERGAAAIGGCCRTRPQHIAQLRRELLRLEPDRAVE